MGSFLFGIIIFVIYFLPSIIGYKHRNANSICLVNLFLGWTLIGWVVAIVWAVSYEKPVEVSLNKSNYDKVTDQLIQLKELYEDGTLTKQEFEKEKRRVLNK
ncbi:superinfection immunity protein [Flavobacterium sp.]|uniref:superinfection immunity protein n=1 Tax=Flavobacterium sp. TaxID=239 RepID=UPI003752E33F